MAEALGVPRGTVKSRLSRALERLRARDRTDLGARPRPGTGDDDDRAVGIPGWTASWRPPSSIWPARSPRTRRRGWPGRCARRIEDRPAPRMSAPGRPRGGSPDGWIAASAAGDRFGAGSSSRWPPCWSSPGSRPRSASGCPACGSSSSAPGRRDRRRRARHRSRRPVDRSTASGSVAPTLPPTAPPLDSLGLGRRLDPGDLDAAAGRHILLGSLTRARRTARRVRPRDAAGRRGHRSPTVGPRRSPPARSPRSTLAGRWRSS